MKLKHIWHVFVPCPSAQGVWDAVTKQLDIEQDVSVREWFLLLIQNSDGLLVSKISMLLWGIQRHKKKNKLWREYSVLPV